MAKKVGKRRQKAATKAKNKANKLAGALGAGRMQRGAKKGGGGGEA